MLLHRHKRVVCRRRIFCEPFDRGVLARYAQRTARLETIVHHLGLALGGRPGAVFSKRLMMSVSKDTLLRVVRRRVAQQSGELTVIGIDDFAFRRGQTYGTIVCDLERRKPVTLLPDRALRPHAPGLQHTRRLRSSHATAVGAMAKRSQKDCQLPSSSRTDGI